MKQYRTLIFILVVVAISIYLAVPPTVNVFGKTVTTHLGLDLVGGVQALLQADLPNNAQVSTGDMNTARTIVENRVNGLGVNESVVQLAGNNRIVVEIPGVANPDEALKTIQNTGLLEFVDMSQISQQEALNLVGQTIQTDWAQQQGSTGSAVPTTAPTGAATPTPTTAASGAITSTTTSTTTVPAPAGSITGTNTTGTNTTKPVTQPDGKPWHTVMTGAGIQNVAVQSTQVGGYEVAFQLKSGAPTTTFKDFTSTHVGKILAIVLDKKVISVPNINNAIDNGQGVITGGFTSQSANALAVQLRYGSLPVPLKVVESSTIGPTLGAESLRRSLIAGIIGLSIVILFMALYYRLPGVIADLALICYSLIAFALFRTIPVTLTLPGIAGFVLSIGMAVDANILIFERLKEELRNGKTLRAAIDLGWSRAWPSIRDANFSTLITCAILHYFGSTYGASIVKGFSLTLALGVGVSLFTAVIVTRTFLHTVLDNLRFSEHPRWFGI